MESTKTHPNPPRSLLPRGVLLASIFLIGLLGLWFLSLPVRYRGAARIKIEEIHRSPAEPYNPYILLEVMDSIRSPQTLNPIVGQLNLPERWKLSPELCLQQLDRNLMTRQFRGTSIIQIEFTDPNPDFSVAITSAIARQYIESTSPKPGGSIGLVKAELVEAPTTNPKRLPWYALWQ
jgi:hypothetical protein